MTQPNWCAFPISGPQTRPSANDYELEAMLLREDGAAMVRTKQRGWHKPYEQARRFARVARRKAFLEQQSSKQVKTTQEAA